MKKIFLFYFVATSFATLSLRGSNQDKPPIECEQEQVITRCANCQHNNSQSVQAQAMQNVQNNQESYNNQNNNQFQSSNIQKNPIPSIILANVAQAAIYAGNICADPKNKPAVHQNVCNIIACVANAAAQALKNIKIEDINNQQEIEQEIYRYLVNLDLEDEIISQIKPS